MNGWIKLYRKLLDNEILKDRTALTIFIWLLLKVDKDNGKKTIGRFWASDELSLKSSTFYKALKRLEKKHEMVTLSSNNKNTTVCIVNWAKYQSKESRGVTSGNNKVTTKEQQSNTLQEVKNKEYKNIYIQRYEKKRNAVKSKCPLGKTKHNTECIPLLLELAKMKNLPKGWLTMGKQISALHKLIRSGYTRNDIRKVAQELDNDKFMWDKWDVMTIVSQIERKGKEVIIRE